MTKPELKRAIAASREAMIYHLYESQRAAQVGSPESSSRQFDAAAKHAAIFNALSLMDQGR
jgi:hypothetical protein